MCDLSEQGGGLSGFPLLKLGQGSIREHGLPGLAKRLNGMDCCLGLGIADEQALCNEKIQQSMDLRMLTVLIGENLKEFSCQLIDLLLVSHAVRYSASLIVISTRSNPGPYASFVTVVTSNPNRSKKG